MSSAPTASSSAPTTSPFNFKLPPKPKPQPRPPLDPKWRGKLFDLDGDPNTFSRNVRIYLAHLGLTKERRKRADVHTEPVTAEDEADQDAPLVTHARICRGLDILREWREEDRGLFLESYTDAELAARPRYPFIPLGIPEQPIHDLLVDVLDSKDTPKSALGEEFFCTNVELVVPQKYSDASPPFYRTLVKWIYSFVFPYQYLDGLERSEYVDGFDDWIIPINVDERYNDAWVDGRIEEHIQKFIDDLETLWVRGLIVQDYDPDCSWAVKKVRMLDGSVWGGE